MIRTRIVISPEALERLRNLSEEDIRAKFDAAYAEAVKAQDPMFPLKEAAMRRARRQQEALARRLGVWHPPMEGNDE